MKGLDCGPALTHYNETCSLALINSSRNICVRTHFKINMAKKVRGLLITRGKNERASAVQAASDSHRSYNRNLKST